MTNYKIPNLDRNLKKSLSSLFLYVNIYLITQFYMYVESFKYSFSNFLVLILLFISNKASYKVCVIAHAPESLIAHKGILCCQLGGFVAFEYIKISIFKMNYACNFVGCLHHLSFFILYWQSFGVKDLFSSILYFIYECSIPNIRI